MEIFSVQLFASVTVTVILFPEVTPEMVQLFPPLSVTVPSEEVTVPLLTSKDTEYVDKSVEHDWEAGVIAMVGLAFMVSVTGVLLSLTQPLPVVRLSA